MTIISRISILLLICMSVTSCHLFGPEPQVMQFPKILLVETQKHVENSVNHFMTVMMTNSPLALESNANVTYLGFQKKEAFAQKVDAVFESKLGAEEVFHFSPYQVKSPKTWTLVAKGLKKLKGKYVATMYLLNPEGKRAWKRKMYVKYVETTNANSAVISHGENK